MNNITQEEADRLSQEEIDAMYAAEEAKLEFMNELEEQVELGNVEIPIPTDLIMSDG